MNGNLIGSSIQDGYIEFILIVSNKEFVNSGSLHFELKVSPTLSTGSGIGEDTFFIIDGLDAMVISKVNTHLNSCPIENNSNTGLWQYIETLVISGTS